MATEAVLFPFFAMLHIFLCARKYFSRFIGLVFIHKRGSGIRWLVGACEIYLSPARKIVVGAMITTDYARLHRCKPIEDLSFSGMSSCEAV